MTIISLFLYNGREGREKVIHLKKYLGAGKPPASWELLPCLSPSFRTAGLKDHLMSPLLSVFVSFQTQQMFMLLYSTYYDHFPYYLSLILLGFCLWG